MKVNWEQEVLMKHSMSDKFSFLTQPVLHWVSLKVIKMNREVKL